MNEQTIDIFAGLDEYEVRHALEQFRAADVAPGAEIMAEGDVDPALVLVESGELRVYTGDTELGRVRSGEILGEIALFSDGLRSASVETVSDCRLLVLDADGYANLRAEEHPVAFALEEYALGTLTRRLRTMREQIGRMAVGTAAARFSPPKGMFDRFAAAMGGGGIGPTQVDGAAVLGKSDLFAGNSPEVLRQVARHFTALAARTGHVLCVEGSPGDEAYLIADGLVDVVCATHGGKVEPLASLGAGEAFGMCALLDPQPRMATCIARERTVLLAIGQVQWAEVIHSGDAVGSALRVAMIRSLAASLAHANGQLAMLDMKRHAEEERTAAIRRAELAVESGGALGAARPQWYEAPR